MSDDTVTPGPGQRSTSKVLRPRHRSPVTAAELARLLPEWADKPCSRGHGQRPCIKIKEEWRCLKRCLHYSGPLPR